MSERSDVDDYLDGLSHPRLDQIARLRAAILASDVELTESVKWNAPSFRYRGADRVTFRLKPRDQFQVVLHRGSTTAADDVRPTGIESPLITWITPDRGVIDVPDDPDFERQLGPLVDVIRAWARA